MASGLVAQYTGLGMVGEGSVAVGRGIDRSRSMADSDLHKAQSRDIPSAQFWLENDR